MHVIFLIKILLLFAKQVLMCGGGQRENGSLLRSRARLQN